MTAQYLEITCYLGRGIVR